MQEVRGSILGGDVEFSFFFLVEIKLTSKTVYKTVLRKYAR